MIAFRALLLLAVCLAMPATHANAQSLKEWGVFVLPGKGGGALASVVAAVQKEGAKAVAPAMSYNSGYHTYDATLNEVGTAVARLRSQGAKRIAIVGQSIGANVALGYGAQRGGVQAIVAMAPGHQPDRFLKNTGESLSRAKQMVAGGHGNDTAEFVDVNQGKVLKVRTTAAAYVSFFDPNGPALMSKNRGNLQGASLLWVIGAGDAAAQSVASGGKIVTVQGGHFETPRVGAQAVVDWLKTL